MVSTRQMTGATSEESSLHSIRVLPGSTSSSNTVTISSSNTSKPTTTAFQSSPASPSEFGMSSQSSYASNSLTSVELRNDNVCLALATNAQHVQQKQELNLMDLPTEILGHIFAFVGFKKIAHMRVISRQMNQVCSTLLNSTFQKLQNQMHARFQTVKAKMPRRESARRNHPLACECDILETCYMRLSLLQMTFGKHIERKHCCFFPGGILDEVYSVLYYIRTSPSLDRPYKVTDELFDLSTMAMEYFKEHIEPNLPDLAYFANSTKSFAALETSSSILSRDTSHSSSSSPPQSNMVLRKGIRKIKQGMKRYNNQLTVLRSELRTCKRKATEQAKTITEQQKLLSEQQKQTLEFANRLDETDKKNDELSRKFSTVLQELNKCKTELQYWRSKSPATTICNPHGQVVPPYDLQTVSSQNVVPYDIDVLTVGIPRSGIATSFNGEGNRKRDEPGQFKERFECVSHTLIANESLTESSDSHLVILAKPGSKRKLDCLTASESDESGNVAFDNGHLRLEGGLACLNPPFAAASLAASYSSSSHSPAMNTSAASGDGIQFLSSSSAFSPKDRHEAHPSTESFTTGLENSTVSTSVQTNTVESIANPKQHDRDATNLPFTTATASFFNNTKAIHLSHTNHVENQSSAHHNNSSSFSSNVDSKNDSTSNDSNTNQIKKIRKVQNKARSQSYNKQTNHSATINTHTKTTRSKQFDKQSGN
uniref:F-box domain-containing protein n=1 Tax=Anopheles farauti TaxID=69004 RepID=A0A182Q7J9_9DIPT